MAKAGRGKTRRDPKRRVLRPGESIRADGKYQPTSFRRERNRVCHSVRWRSR